ncbi:MAG: radical SAM protein [Thermodesulfobacteriota bacterium]
MNRHRRHIALLYRGPQQEGRDEFSDFVPVGLFYVLNSLLAAGYRASLHNLSATPRRGLAAAVRATGADLVLLSSFYGAHHQAFLLADLVRRQLPGRQVVLGGPISLLAGEILARVPAVDFVVRGEGEESVPRLADALLLGKGDPAGIAGVFFRAGDRMHGRPPELLADLDRHLFLPSALLPHCHGVRPENFAVLISSRGCPYRCSFCSSASLWQNRLRRHDPALLIRYLADLRQATGSLYFSMRDENFLAGRAHVLRFCSLLRESGLSYLWNTQGSAAFIDDELAGQLAAAGCDQVQMGIETVSPRLQRLLAKEIDPASVMGAAASLRRQAIRPFGYFIYGMGESDGEIRENLDFIGNSGLLDAVASPLVHYPGTPLAADLDADRFFAAGEMLLYDPAGARRLRPRYEAALTRLATRGGFRKGELSTGESRHAVEAVARYYGLLQKGDATKAARVLQEYGRHHPADPWPGYLLGQMDGRR